MRQVERVENIRLGLLLNKEGVPSEKERRLFFEQFGSQHSFLIRSWRNKFHVLSSTGAEEPPPDSLPVDYLYAPDDWERRITDDQIRNVLLSLRHSQNDFLIISTSLSEFPLIQVSSIKNHTIFSKELGLEFPEKQSAKPAKGKVVRLPPYVHAVIETDVEQLFRGHSVTWAPKPCWPPRHRLVKPRLSSGDRPGVFIPT